MITGGQNYDTNTQTGASPAPDEEGALENLNGEWDFSFDFGCSGIDQKWQEGKTDWEKKILVPFCPESDLSGIGYKDFIPGVWYHRTITLTGEELKGDLLLHFGAVDYDARVWINGVEAGRHQGGYVSFTFNITKLVKEGEMTLRFLQQMM